MYLNKKPLLFDNLRDAKFVLVRNFVAKLLQIYETLEEVE
jgi:hypothetical protein